MLKYLFFLSACSASFLHTKQSDPIVYDWHIPESFEEASSWSKIAAYQIASYLTDPLCKAREYMIRAQILDALPASSSIKNSIEPLCSFVKKMQLIDESWLDTDFVAKFTEKCLLLSGSALLSIAAPFTAAPAAMLRFVTANLETDRFIHYKGFFSEKELGPERCFNHMLWNVCGIKAGYDIEEGGQMPIQDDFLPFSEQRIFKIAEKILEEDPDVLCLNEVFDIRDALYLVNALQKRYAHFVIHCGTRTLGTTSGLFFATKFAVEDVSFTPFAKDALYGLAKYAEKGFLSVKTKDSKGPIANFITTHLQHSDQAAFPSYEEEMSRKKELECIMEHISPAEDAILAGDLNLEDAEFVKTSAHIYSQFNKTVSYLPSSSEEERTWLGDEWYVQHGNQSLTLLSLGRKEEKRLVSPSLNLDHVLVKKREEASSPSVNTVLKRTGYDPQRISRDSLSDHMILLSQIHLP